jgi:hypothetical protein
MATQVSPQPFQPGPRLVDGSDLNKAVSQDILTSQTGAVANGTTKATGTQITAAITEFDTVAPSGVAILPPAVAGTNITVFNYGANTLTIYPYATTDTIDGGSAGASTTLSATNRAVGFFATSAGAWRSGLLGAVSS